ncbi:hypothetical protein PVDT1_06 (plasmid) [Vibrio sp. 16]|nr:hypothetical protein PVDT1_06 [Vibrio sp. 16]
MCTYELILIVDWLKLLSVVVGLFFFFKVFISKRLSNHPYEGKKTEYFARGLGFIGTAFMTWALIVQVIAIYEKACLS